MPPKRPQSALRRRDTGIINSATDAGQREVLSTGDNVDGSNDNQASSNALSDTNVAVEEKPALFKLDDYIECRLPQWSDYFKGYVKKVEKGNVYTVLFDDGERVKGIPENLMRKVIIVDFSVNEIIEAKCEGWIKYYKGEIIKKVDNMHYNIKFMDGEVKKNIPSVRMRKLEEISKPPPRPATGTGTRVMTSHSASRPMSAAAAGSYKAPQLSL